MNDLCVRALSVNELTLLPKLFRYKDIKKMIKENTENIQNSTVEIFGLFINGRLIGEIRAKYKSSDVQEAVYGKRVYLFAFRIHKKFQGKGYGTYLLQSVLNILLNRGYYEFTVGVEDDNIRAKHIYSNFGFDKIICRKYEEYEGYKYQYNLYLKCDKDIIR